MGAAHGWDSLQADIDRARRQLDISERAELEGRVVDRGSYLASMERRRRLLREMEDEARSREESAAELAYGGEAA